ncbi:MAG: HEAT repeat domain-containing protein [Cyanobacteriota bacterium]|nr:HEAT repeat domain-containing protein [Cyanobacteriota bacterium]
MVEWLAIWGVTQAVGFVFKPILEDLAKDAAKDYAKDFFKSSIGNVFKGLNREPLQKATGKAIKEFLELVQQELEDADLDETQLKQYIKPLKLFIKNPDVAKALGSAFQNEVKVLDTKTLATMGNEINLSLPKNFNWGRVGKLYLKKAKAIRIESDELREILNAENLDKLANQNTEIKPEFDLKKYQEGIQEQYGNLKLESLDTSGYAYNQLKLWRMFIPQNVRESQEFLPQVHEIPIEYRQRLKDTGQFGEDFSQEQLEGLRRRYLERPISSVLELIEDRNYQYLVILGDPGSGKSTLLQYIALQWAELPLKDLPLHPIPILIELRTYVRNHNANKCKNFLDFLEKGSGLTCQLPQDKLHAKLQNDDAIVMFDGLDEVFDPAKREEIITDIHRFTNDYKNVRVIVTSRVIGYKPQKLRDAEFYHFMLQDLEEEQVEDFIQSWHNLTYLDEAERERKRERLKRAIKDSSAINELSGNPLLLTMMAILNRHQELPRDRAELYNQSSRILLHQWDVEEKLIDAKIEKVAIDHKDKQAILRQVAFFMQGNKEGLAGNLIYGNDLERIIREYLKSIDINDARTLARALIEQLRSRNFILCFVGAEYYAFVHRTFLEYFCAWEFVLRFEKEQKISKKELIEDVFGSHWRDEKWHEVLRLISGMIDAKFVGEIISYLMEQEGEEEKFLNLFLAGKCLFEVRSRHSIGDVESRLLNRLKYLTEYDLGYYYEPYSSRFFDNSYSQKIYNKNVALVREIRTQAVEVVAATWRDDNSTYTWLKQKVESDDNSDVRVEAVRQIATGWKHESGILDLLKQWVESIGNRYVRVEAVRQIATGWKHEAGTLDLLKQLVVSDDNSDVRVEAVRQIATCWKHESGIFELLKQLVEFDYDWEVRVEALRQIATGWKHESGIFKLLKQLVESDDNSDVQVEALRQIATGWKHESGILDLLKQLVEFDYDWEVRVEALRQIATGWKHESGILDLLEKLVEYDNDLEVRCEVVEQVASGWKHESGVLNLLQEWAESNDNEYARGEAVRQIATGWKHEPGILDFLKQLVVSDESSIVRSEAVRQIATGWKNEKRILELFKQWVVSNNYWQVRYEVVKQISTGWKHESGILDLLKQRLESDENSQVREEVIRQISTGWKHESGILDLLRQRVVSDDEGSVRREALRQIATGWKHESGILDLFKQLVEFDADWEVRVEAVRQIATGWKHESGIFELFYHTALNDPFQHQNYYQYNPRQTALEAIVKHYPEHPQTLSLLQDRAENDPDEKLRKWAKEKLRRFEN